MSVSTSTAPRRRRAPAVAREEILSKARDLLVRLGPGAVTLKAVSGELGMTHANLLHHFGSAAGLQAALAAGLVGELLANVEAVAARLRDGDASEREIVDLAFEAFSAGGAGRLIAWLVVTGETEQLRPVFDAVRGLAANLESKTIRERAAAQEMIGAATLGVLMPAISDALIGAELHAALGRPRGKARELATAALQAAISGNGTRQRTAQG